MANKKTNGKDPAVLLYTQDFLVGTLTMTDEQRGKYILLLCYQHQKENKLTLNDLKLAEGDEVVLERFPLHEDGYYYNNRMAMEIENRKNFTESRRSNGIKGGRPKKETYEKPNGFHMVNLNETYNKPNNKPTNNLAEDENENENEIVTEAEADKLLDNLMDITKFRKTLKDIEKLGGIEIIYDTLNFDNSQRKNWNNHIQQKQLTINQTL